jgi:hypothetical protein
LLVISGSPLDNVDSEFGAIGLGEPSLGFESGRNGAIAELARVAPLVELKQLRR